MKHHALKTIDYDGDMLWVCECEAEGEDLSSRDEHLTKAAAELIHAHIPNLTKAVEAKAMTDDPEAWDEDGDYVGIMRECACGVAIEGFYQYADHLAAIFGVETHYGG